MQRCKHWFANGVTFFGGKALRDWQFGEAWLGGHARPESSREDRDAREDARLAEAGKYTRQEEEGICQIKG